MFITPHPPTPTHMELKTLLLASSPAPKRLPNLLHICSLMGSEVPCTLAPAVFTFASSFQHATREPIQSISSAPKGNYNGKVFANSHNGGKLLTSKLGVREVIRGWGEEIVAGERVSPMFADKRENVQITPQIIYDESGGCRRGESFSFLAKPMRCMNENQAFLAKCGTFFRRQSRSNKGLGSWSRGFQVFASLREGTMEQDGIIYHKEESPMKHYMWPDAKRPRICILGGGFGGLYTALRLESLVWPADKMPQILLVDQSDRFVFKPMLYELLSKEVDPWEIAPLFTQLLSNTSIQFCKDKVKTVSPCDGLKGNAAITSPTGNIGGMVLLESGLQVEYDWLLLALGAEAKTDIVPGSLEYALPFSTLEDALEVDKRLKVLERERFGPCQPPIKVIIVGSGYCGVELAATLAERLGERGKVQVVDMSPDICPAAPAGNRESALKVLSSRSVELVLGYLVNSVRKVSVDKAMLGQQAEPSPFLLDIRPAQKNYRRLGHHSSTLEADLILWTVGSRPCLPSGDLYMGSQSFPINGRGQAEIDETLRVKGHPRIFAIGDSAGLRDSSGRPLPTTAQVAFQQADYAGWNMWAAINNRPLLPFRYQSLGEMMTLGRNDAAVTVSFIDGLTLDGPLGHTARKLAYLYRLPTNEHRIKVGLSWLTKSAVDAIATLQDTIAQAASSSS